jgi:hypothetical protein
LIVAACLATALKKYDFDGFFDLIGGGIGSESKN